MEYPWRDEELLREMYHQRGMSLKEIAEEFDTHHSTIHSWMERFGIERRQQPQDKPPLFRTENRGYEVWRTEVDGVNHKVRVHRLTAVAEYGFETVSELDHIHHKNKIPWDNRPTNLEPISATEHSRTHSKT